METVKGRRTDGRAHMEVRDPTNAGWRTRNPQEGEEQKNRAAAGGPGEEQQKSKRGVRGCALGGGALGGGGAPGGALGGGARGEALGKARSGRRGWENALGRLLSGGGAQERAVDKGRSGKRKAQESALEEENKNARQRDVFVLWRSKSAVCCLQLSRLKCRQNIIFVLQRAKNAALSAHFAPQMSTVRRFRAPQSAKVVRCLNLVRPQLRQRDVFVLQKRFRSVCTLGRLGQARKKRCVPLPEAPSP